MSKPGSPLVGAKKQAAKQSRFGFVLHLVVLIGTLVAGLAVANPMQELSPQDVFDRMERNAKIAPTIAKYLPGWSAFVQQTKLYVEAHRAEFFDFVSNEEKEIEAGKVGPAKPVKPQQKAGIPQNPFSANGYPAALSSTNFVRAIALAGQDDCPEDGQVPFPSCPGERTTTKEPRLSPLTRLCAHEHLGLFDGQIALVAKAIALLISGKPSVVAHPFMMTLSKISPDEKLAWAQWANPFSWRSSSSSGLSFNLIEALQKIDEVVASEPKLKAKLDEVIRIQKESDEKRKPGKGYDLHYAHRAPLGNQIIVAEAPFDQGVLVGYCDGDETQRNLFRKYFPWKAGQIDRLLSAGTLMVKHVESLANSSSEIESYVPGYGALVRSVLGQVQADQVEFNSYVSRIQSGLIHFHVKGNPSSELGLVRSYNHYFRAPRSWAGHWFPLAMLLANLDLPEIDFYTIPTWKEAFLYPDSTIDLIIMARMLFEIRDYGTKLTDVEKKESLTNFLQYFRDLMRGQETDPEGTADRVIQFIRSAEEFASKCPRVLRDKATKRPAALQVVTKIWINPPLAKVLRKRYLSGDKANRKLLTNYFTRKEFDPGKPYPGIG